MKRWSSRIRASLVALVLVAAGPLLAADEFPTRPISAIVPYGAGGPTDNIARLLATLAEPDLGQKLVIVNRPGANGTLGVAQALRGKPDGYTIAYTTPAIMGLQPLVSDTPFKTASDYTPIVKLVEAPAGLVVQAESPIRDLEDFVARARREPGMLRVSVSGRLTEPDISIQLLNAAAKIDVVTIPFTGGSADALTALLGGHVEAHVAVIPNLIAQVQAGKLRLLTVFAKERSPLFPNVPTASERGFDVKLATMYFLLGPRDLEAGPAARLQQAFTKALLDPRFQEYARREGFKVEPLAGTALTSEVAWYAETYQKIVSALKPEAKQ
jgi:tripartite-type tricarboxylate transporter receptor subunit TctC